MAKKFSKSYAERAAAYMRKQRQAKAPKSKPKADPNREVAPGLTAAQLARATRAATQLKYGEAGQQLAAQPKRINSWFAQYQQALEQAKQAQADTYGHAVTGVQNLQSGLDDAAAKEWAGQQQAMAADAAKRGATADPGLADVAHNASNVRNVLTAGYGAMLLGQGANEGAYLTKRKVNADVGRIQSLRGNAQERQRLARERGAFKQTYRDQAISDASSTALKNALTASQLGNTAADNARADKSLVISDRNTDAGRHASTAKWANTVNKFGYTNGQWKRMSPAAQAKARKEYKASGGKPVAPTHGAGSLTPAKEHEYISQIHTIADYFAHPPVVDDGEGNKHTMTSAEIVAMLKSGKNPLKKSIDPRVINVARSLFQNGGRGIGSWGVGNAHDLGIHVNGNFKVIGKKAKKKPTSAADVVGQGVQGAAS